MMDGMKHQNGPRDSNRLLTATMFVVLPFVLFALRTSMMIKNNDFALGASPPSRRMLKESPITSSSVRGVIQTPARSVLDESSSNLSSIASATSTSSSPIASGVVQTVSCNKLIEEEYSDQIYNEKHSKLFLRYTNGGPQFWISLHNKEYDPVRWAINDYGHYYETAQSDAFVEILAKSNSPRVIDVGGNIGWFSLLSAQVGAKVDVFEPNKKNYLRMCESICLNGWMNEPCQGIQGISSSSSSLPPSGRVHVHPHGVGSKVEKVFFTTNSTNNPGAGHVVEHAVTKNEPLEKGGTLQSIQLVPLDLVASEQGWYDETIDILKLDVEGYELHVIHGAMTLLRSHVIQNIFMEGDVGSIKEIQVFLEIAETLLNAGYIPYKIGGFRGPSNIIEDLSGDPRNEASSNNKTYATALKHLCRGGEHAKKKRKQCNLWWQLASTTHSHVQ